MPGGQQPLLYSIKDAAARLGVSESTVWRLIRQGRLRATRLLGRTLLAEAELQRIAEVAADKPRGAGEKAISSRDAGSDERLQTAGHGGFDGNKRK
jgi:excisionase family DNA binding protein